MRIKCYLCLDKAQFMKTKLKIFVITAFIGLFAFASCDEVDSISIFDKNNIPEAIKEDFYARYGDVVVTDAVLWAYDGHIAIDFNDQNGIPCKATYQDGEWIMTTKDLGEDSFLLYVPDKVRQSFSELGYNNPRFDIIDNTNRAYEITRKGIDHEVYDFRFHIQLDDGSFAPLQILINEDGLILLNSREGYNKQELFYWADNTPFNIIDEKYPDADIRSYANNGGRHQYFIIHDERIKIVSFDLYSSDFIWTETVYELDEDANIPSKIMDYYEQLKITDSRYSDLMYDRLLFKESRFNNWYGFQDTKREDKLILWINVNVENDR